MQQCPLIHVNLWIENNTMNVFRKVISCFKIVLNLPFFCSRDEKGGKGEGDGEEEVEAI